MSSSMNQEDEFQSKALIWDLHYRFIDIKRVP